jgi:hypothetical protein
VLAIDPQELSKGAPYIAEYIEAIERTERFGFEAPPRVIAQKDGVDMFVVMPVLLDFYEGNSPEDLMGQTMAINFALVPELHKKTGIHFNLTTGWMVREGRPIFPHDDDLIRRFIKGGSDEWLKAGFPFHLWLTAMSCEIVDVTFAMNMGHALTRAQCARRVVYQSARVLAEDFIYHPTVVGPDFYYKTGAIL